MGKNEVSGNKIQNMGGGNMMFIGMMMVFWLKVVLVIT
jgi:hypothetical protein